MLSSSTDGAFCRVWSPLAGRYQCAAARFRRAVPDWFVSGLEGLGDEGGPHGKRCLEGLGCLRQAGCIPKEEVAPDLVPVSRELPTCPQSAAEGEPGDSVESRLEPIRMLGVLERPGAKQVLGAWLGNMPRPRLQLGIGGSFTGSLANASANLADCWTQACA
jgi:hypothetical protein